MSRHNKYKLSRAEALRQVDPIVDRYLKYLTADAEDTEILSHDPTRRDAIIAQLYADPNVKPSCWPRDIVGTDPSPEECDEYLAQADAAIDKLTPPQSLEDRVTRCHIATAAILVLQEYKWGYALQDYYDLQDKVFVQYNDKFADWMKNVFPQFRAQHPNVGLGGHPTCSSSMRQPSLSYQTPLIPPPMQNPGSPKAFSAEEVANFLSSPHTLLGKQFRSSPPPVDGHDYEGMWEVESYTTRMPQGRIDYEFVILLKDFGSVAIPMGQEEVKLLLTHSVIVA